MYVLAINGSPRKGGNTEILLQKALAPLANQGWETELVQVGGKKLKGCIACGKCFENKDNNCIIKNDMFNELFEKALRADAIILGTPTYFTDVSAELKGLIDRMGMVALANGRKLAGKIGAAVVAVRRGGATHAFDSINHMYLMSQMIVPGSIYWNLGVGLAPGDVKNDAEAMANMESLGETIHWLGTAMKPHKESFPVSTFGSRE
ncbi:flavodoxin family protein [Halodesulfovibrio sp.]|jgi:multimeric flavodoxin WrbA|uniref:flavodoxin family protein n=1 Tax=Halodesulfovibrio sp. TaxID=1912772 RepID=UPI0025F08151|nr:flavodoxin family protein [Halodesulfovibrio sp.]MCT4625526.1 flavodoxin family protein [Halodesulfovibrio sp.]